jgi:hypothetical protein
LQCWSILNALSGVFSMEDVARRVELGLFTNARIRDMAAMKSAASFRRTTGYDRLANLA